MADESDDSREMGIGFGDLDDALAARDYPASLSEILSDHGDAELELEDETTTLRSVLSPLQEETFESAEDVRQAVFNMVPDEAVGREEYTDRGGVATGTDAQEDQESL